MPRRETVGIAARRAYRNRDVHQFVWSMLKLTEEEIEKGVPGKSRTFSGRDIVGFVNTLVNLERVRKEIAPGGRDDDEDYGSWGKPPPLQVVDDDEEEEDE